MQAMAQEMASQVQAAQSLYECDYHSWVMATAQKLSRGQFDALDVENLLEEVLELGRRDKRKLESLLTCLWEHLLKLRYWEGERLRNQEHWEGEVTNSRVQIKRVLKVSPSLVPYIEEVMGDCYRDAQLIVSRRAELPLESLPEEPITTVKELLDLHWFPNS